jgi:hypothetical protein
MNREQMPESHSQNESGLSPEEIFKITRETRNAKGEELESKLEGIKSSEAKLGFLLTELKAAKPKYDAVHNKPGRERDEQSAEETHNDTVALAEYEEIKSQVENQRRKTPDGVKDEDAISAYNQES